MTPVPALLSRLPSLALSILAVSVCFGAGSASRAAQNTDPSQLAGTYRATYPALIGDKAEIWKIEKFLTIRATEEPNLFLYEQCWRRADGGDWNAERGGLVVTSRPNAAVELAISEVREAGPKRGEARPGVMTGRMLGSDGVEIVYTGLESGVVFRGEAKRTERAVDKSSCPLK